MNIFDLSILNFLNTFAHRSETFDSLVVFLLWNNFVKGGIIMGFFWWAWAQDDERAVKREYLLLGFGLSIASVIAARLLALSLPFRERPLRNPLLDFQLPYTMDGSALETWSSFPSDHAVVFFSLAAAIWFASRRLGIVAALYALFVISLPRIYAGVHYPTDVVAGAVLGWCIASFSKVTSLRIHLARPVLRWMEKQPGAFYSLLFLATFELAELFSTLRIAAHPVTHLIKPFLQGRH
jgi:undecaprenyl-diphosphatase